MPEASKFLVNNAEIVDDSGGVERSTPNLGITQLKFILVNQKRDENLIVKS